MAGRDVRSRLPSLVAELAIRPGDAILDVGGGTGVLIPLLCGAAGDPSKVVCLDIAEEMLKLAKRNGHKGNIHYVHADAAAIPLSSEAFDVVVCYSCFPHFPDKVKALTEMARVLRRGGRLVVCHAASRQAINELHKSIGSVVANDTIPAEATMRDMFVASGLKPVEVRDEPDRYLAFAVKPTG
jgi:ubiquinone/menaquinone biosynthesis C-methylase UbiE